MDQQPFYIGQKLVAVQDHSWRMVLKGIEYTVTEIGQCTKCYRFWVSVGVINHYGGSICKCGANPIYKGEMRFNPQLFAPVQESFQAITFEKVMEQELLSVN